ncbi:hypothetical protein HDU79_008084 [Rhizoclosmatium sp. JEL0117]|nr:hypothetical protein HDU79_008084 [Rhizoclosmatium sp. JEL0117]
MNATASPACGYALIALSQEGHACFQAPTQILANSCYCTSLDPESVFAYCSPNDDKSIWYGTWSQTVTTRSGFCVQANLTVPTNKTLLNLPADIPNPLTSIKTAGSVKTTAGASSLNTTATLPSVLVNDGIQLQGTVGLLLILSYFLL